MCNPTWASKIFTVAAFGEVASTGDLDLTLPDVEDQESLQVPRRLRWLLESDAGW